MSTTDEKLKKIRAQLKKGVVPPKETVRSFLLWFGAERRGWHVVHRIRFQLDKHELITVPDFAYAYIDGQISFKEKEGDTSGQEFGNSALDPTYRIGCLESANRPPTSVKPDATLQQAITLVLVQTAQGNWR